MFIDCEMGYVTYSEDARCRNDWTQQLLRVLVIRRLVLLIAIGRQGEVNEFLALECCARETGETFSSTCTHETRKNSGKQCLKIKIWKS